MMDKNDPKLTAFVLDELTAPEREEVVKAMKDSPEINRAVEEIRAAVTGVRTLFTSDNQVGLDSKRRDQLVQQIEAGHDDSDAAGGSTQLASAHRTAAHPPGNNRNNQSWRWWLASVAALLLVGLSVMFLNPQLFQGTPLAQTESVGSDKDVDISESVRGGAIADEAAPESAADFEDEQKTSEFGAVAPGFDFSPDPENGLRDQYRVEEETRRVESDDSMPAPDDSMPAPAPPTSSTPLESSDSPRRFNVPADGDESRMGLLESAGQSGQRYQESPQQSGQGQQSSDIEFSVDQERLDSFGIESGLESDGNSGGVFGGGGGQGGGGGRRGGQGRGFGNENQSGGDGQRSRGIPSRPRSQPEGGAGITDGVVGSMLVPGSADPIDSRAPLAQSNGVAGSSTRSGRESAAEGEDTEKEGRALDDLSLDGQTPSPGDVAGDVTDKDEESGVRLLRESRTVVPEFSETTEEEILKGLKEQIANNKTKFDESNGDGLPALLAWDDGKWEESEGLKEEMTRAVERTILRLESVDVPPETRKELAENFLRRKIREAQELAKQKRTWRRSRATPNASRLMIGERDELDLQGMQVHVQVEGFRARVLIDCFYYNDRDRQLEGNFKLRLPDDASLYYFAFGESVIDYANVAGNPDDNGALLSDDEFLPQGRQFVSLRPETIARQRQETWEKVKESRMVPREKAAHAYSQTVRRRVDPALVEWSGAGVFNARVFPLMPNKQHRIVIGYDVDLKRTEDGWSYEVDLPDFAKKCRVDMDVLQLPGTAMKVTPEVKPEETESDEYGSHWHYTFRDFETEAIAEEDPEAITRRFVRLDVTDPGTLLLRSDDESEGNFFATRVVPDLPVVEAESNSHAIFLLDTSLSSQPDKFNVWLSMLRETLTANRDSLKYFNVLFFDVGNHFWKDAYVENKEAAVDDLIAYCETLALEGATDLYGALQTMSTAQWIGKDSVRPDVFLLSDGAANWGETNLRLLLARYESLDTSSLFAYQSGLDGTAIASLRFLAAETGGAVFSIASEAEVKTAAKAHRNRPWRVESIEVDGGTDLLTAGRVKWIYPGQPLTIVGRIADDDAETLGGVRLNLAFGGEQKSIDIRFQNEMKSTLASRIYGAVSVGQLESLGEVVNDVATAYSRHFRITGSTCSLLMLESEEDYQRFDIKPEEDLFVIKSQAASKVIDRTLKANAEELADPKVQLTTWLRRLESIPGLTFRMPTALKLAIEELDVVAISESLECEPVLKTTMSEAYSKMLNDASLDYNQVRREAIRRANLKMPGDVADDRIDPAFADDALKVISNLVERNPGDLVLARDVAFMAMELHRPAQAYHLLKQIVRARPFDPSVYTAIGQCLTQMNQPDMAMIYYEIAVTAQFPNRGEDYRKIAATEYAYLLNRIVAREEESASRDYAAARLQSLTNNEGLQPRDLVVTMMWNTDQTDVDLHVIEPSGEECFYQHKTTRSGGAITRDITDGYGPEMYTLTRAPDGEYQILVNYYANNQNRTDMRSKVYLAIYREFGTPQATVTRKTIELNKVGGKQTVDTLSIK